MELTSAQSQVIVATLPVLAGGLISGIVITHLNKRRAEKEYRRSKLEQLYMDSSYYFISIQTLATFYLIAAHGKADVTDMMSREMDRTKGDRTYDSCLMICNLYFPTLLVAFKEIIKQRDIVNDIGSPIYAKLHKSTPDKEQQLLVENKRLTKLCEAFSPLLIAEANKI